MPTPSLSPGKADRIDILKAQGLTNRQIADAVKVGTGTVSKYLNSRSKGKLTELPGEVGVPVDTRDEIGGDTTIITPDKPLSIEEMAKLFKIDLKVWVPLTVTSNQWQGFYKAKSEWTEDKTATGKKGSRQASHQKVALFQTRITWRRIMGESVQEALFDFLKNNVVPMAKPKLPEGKKAMLGADSHMVTWGIWDAHLGMYAWHNEVGESMDITKAVSRVCNSIDDMAKRIVAWPNPIEKIVMPIGNDFLHYDNPRQRTTHGDHHLDADGRFAKIFSAGLRCLAYMIERAVEIAPVEIKFIPGNHDATSAYCLCVALAQRFLNDPRVTFDIKANPRKYVVFGGTIVGFDHGQKCNARQLALIFAEECKPYISQSTYREVQIGHFHQRRVSEFESVTPTNGITIRTNPALGSVDFWHHEQGWIGEPMKSVAASFYSRVGYQGEMVCWASDEDNAAIQKIRLARFPE